MIKKAVFCFLLFVFAFAMLYAAPGVPDTLAGAIIVIPAILCGLYIVRSWVETENM